MKIVYISLYCYFNFPIRNFHSLSRQKGIESTAIFLKDSLANWHDPISEIEMEFFIDLIKEKKPDLICFSVLAPYAVIIKKLIKDLRAISTAPIVVGGKYADVSAERAFEYLNPDFVCHGEGDLVLQDIFVRLENDKNLQGIQGLWWKDANGNVVNEGQRALTQDLDQFPFRAVGEPGMYFINKNQITEDDPELYFEDIWVMAGRGCVYQCSYCVNSVLIPMNKGNGKFVRMRSPDKIIEELKNKSKICKKAKNITFIDEVFGVTYSWVKEFHEKYLQSGLDFSFTINLVPKQIKEKNIKLLADIGLEFVQTGIQSGVDRVRNEIYNRPGSGLEIIEKGHLLKKHNVKPLWDMILENPFETAEDLEDTIKLLLSLPEPKYLNTFKLQFYPGYPMAERAIKAGLLNKNDVSEENVADVLMNRYNFIPTVFSLSRKNYLESCVYILGLSMFFRNYSWIVKSGEYLSGRLYKEKSIVLGLTANLIARIKYALHAKKLAYILKALELLMKGNLLQLFKKSWRVLVKKIFPSTK